jgi:hypothetical protein
MDQHLGASITLSFALVAVFAIVFYQPERTPLPRAEPEVRTGRPARPGPNRQAPIPEPTPAEPLTAAPSRAAIGLDTGEKKPIKIAIADSCSDRPANVPALTSVRVPAGRRPPILPPHQGFTHTLEGETMRDVAIRVYGSSDETESLWMLNRDLIQRGEGALPTGTLLRTPSADQRPLRK